MTDKELARKLEEALREHPYLRLRNDPWLSVVRAAREALMSPEPRGCPIPGACACGGESRG